MHNILDHKARKTFFDAELGSSVLRDGLRALEVPEQRFVNQQRKLREECDAWLTPDDVASR